MVFTANELHEIAGLNTDAIAGFEAQVAGGTKREVLWPRHLVGKRVDDFRKGAQLARDWMAMRRGYAKARRKVRARDFREEGATTTLLPRDSERREEQIRCLREVARFLPVEG